MRSRTAKSGYGKHYTAAFQLTDRLSPLAVNFRESMREDFEFKQIRWNNNAVTASGSSGPTSFHVGFNLSGRTFDIWPTCSICGAGRYCPHCQALIVLMMDSGIAAKIEKSEYAPATYDPSQWQKKDLKNAWKKHLGNFVRQINYYCPPQPPPEARFPAKREAIYVIQQDPYNRTNGNTSVPIQICTRPALEMGNVPAKPLHKNGNLYRNFTAGIRAFAASIDPLDREVAERISLVMTSDGYYGRSQLQFSLLTDTSTELFAKIARSGRLFFNKDYSLHDTIVRLDWLSDEQFDLKFEIAGCEEGQLALGVCLVSPQLTISGDDIKVVTRSFFIDAQNRLGIFREPIPTNVFDTVKTGKPIVVPRANAGELIESVMGLPLGLGIEFIDCDDVRPQRIANEPKPKIHVKAPPTPATPFELKVHFDYDGLLIPLGHRGKELYDKNRGAVIQIDHDFHHRSVDLLLSLGVKEQIRYGETTLTIGMKKFAALVGQLIHHGWHVEADGKLYRAGSSLDINVVSGIDWFELQGDVRFEQTSVDLPRLLQSLRAGERSVVLDDGTIGVIPEDWIKRFRGIAELASNEDGSVKFGKSQVGLLDALLAEQGDFNVDKQFAAARESLRAFDRIQPQEPPAGFIGTLRPYQKLAQGWFEFLRTLGFGGCLADDMGLGKTIQVLSLLEYRRQLKAGPSLIVVPRSLIFNWIAEARKFAPDIRVLDQSHSQRQKGTEHLSDFDLVLTTYGTLRRDAAFLKDFEFDYLVLDEAQAIKNADTEAAKAVRLLTGRHKLALSGTPIENHLGELWSLFDFLNPGMLGRIGRFSGLAHDAKADDRKLLAAAVRPFILRRTKKQVAPELPERVEQTIVVELDADQRRAYDELRDYYRQMLLNKIEKDGIGKSQIVILEALLRLRQAACHPGLVDKSRADEPSAKIEELLSRLASALEAGERVLVFSQFTSLLAIVKKRLKTEKIDFLYLDGKTKNRQALVEEFQSGAGPAVFLISLKAGGVGLNLTAARNVYLLDPWWNPAVEAQAIDRTHRIGQQQTVFATRLITADTVEQKVLELQSKKKGLADAIVNADNAGISSLTREDLALLLA